MMLSVNCYQLTVINILLLFLINYCHERTGVPGRIILHILLQLVSVALDVPILSNDQGALRFTLWKT